MKTTTRSLAVALLASAAFALAGCAGGSSAPGSQSSGGSSKSGSPDAFDNSQDLPPNAQTLFRLSRILAGQGRDEECRFILTDVIAKYPDFAPAYCDLAEVHMRACRADDAAEVLERGLQRLPHDARHRANMAAALGMLGRYDESLAEYEKVVAPAAAHYNVAVLAKAREDQPKAEVEFALATSIDPAVGQKHEVETATKTR